MKFIEKKMLPQGENTKSSNLRYMKMCFFIDTYYYLQGNPASVCKTCKECKYT